MRRVFTFPALIALTVIIAGCQQPLPEQDSYAGQLYARRCGQCHAPYNPRAMTAAMWQIQVPKMEEKIRQAGLPPLEPAQKQVIVDYLERNAGTQ
jgi:Dihaem cytochrome c